MTCIKVKRQFPVVLDDISSPSRPIAVFKGFKYNIYSGPESLIAKVILNNNLTEVSKLAILISQALYF